MKTGRRLIIRTALEIFFVLLLHIVLLHWLAKKQVVAAILSAGDHVPPGWLALVVVFVVVRLFALVLLPGFALQRLLKLAFYFLVERQPEALENDGQPAATTQKNP